MPIIGNIINRIPFERLLLPRPDHTKALGEFASTMTAPVAQIKAPPEQKATPTITQEPETVPQQEDIATACVACALGHFSTSAGLLNEAVRFKAEGITSNEVLDRIAKTLQELNALERVDLTPEKIQTTPDWERELAEDALRQSRNLRHRLEAITTIEELGQAAADTEGYYRNLNRRWWKLRVTQPDKTKPKMTLEEAKELAAEEAAKKVEERWQLL
ncbi:hypothetical protein ES703_97662 [subsurface metagenome]